MTALLRPALTALLAVLIWAPALSAAPTRYVLDARASDVAFLFDLEGTRQRGTMPVRSADVVIDTANLAASRVDVSVDAAGARTQLFFATDAMKGPQVLDTDRFPVIRFVSTAIQLGAGGRLSDGASVSGNLTIRGVTRPVRLQASLYRQRGSSAGDLRELSFRLKGRISRAEFGAAGFRELVRDGVELDIRAVIRKAQ